MNYFKYKLENGLRIIVIPMKDNPTVTVSVLVETGSKYENKQNNGISHFLEHMCFKGTIVRPTAHIIASELDGLGSSYNAFTSNEYTGYYAKSDAKHFEKIFDIISDIYLNSTFPEKEIEKEKGVIVEEINMYEDMPARHVQDLFMNLLYGDQPAGWNIAGTRENVRNTKRSDFVDYKKTQYIPRRTTVIVSGKVKEGQVLKVVRDIFGGIKNTKHLAMPKVVEQQRKPEVLVSYKKTDQTHIVLGVRTFDIFNKRNPILTVLSTILAGGMSSRLFIKLREELGVTYYVRAYNDTYTDHGFLEVSAGVSNDRVKEVVTEILKECKKLCGTPVSKQELDKVKEYLVGNMKLELESSSDFATFYGSQEVMNLKIKKPEEVERLIRKVTAKDIQSMAKTIFTNKGLNLALIGPFEDKKDFEKILKF